MSSAPIRDATQGLGLALAELRIVICVGSGGVGKTTTAATLGLLAARRGRRTLVMTIDPARRLASALGLHELNQEAREVPLEKLGAAGIPAGRFHAMMLEPKRTFDELVRRYAPDPQTVEQLLSSKLYQQVSSRLAGSQEYAAMELLHALHSEGRYDLLVLDTPPTANALDFLDAPGKMVSAVQSPAVALFINAYERAGRLSLDMLGFGASYVVHRLARFVGSAFLDDIAEFLSRLASLLGGMKERAARVQELLRQKDVGFVLVTSPDPRAIDETLAFHDRLKDSGMNLAGLIVNRLHALQDSPLTGPQLTNLLGGTADLGQELAARLAGALLDSHQQWQALARADAAELIRLQAHCGEVRTLVVPLFSEDVFDIKGLLKLGEWLA